MRPLVREEENRSNIAQGEISIIAGGPTGGSLVNIIFKKAFDQLQIDQAELLPMTTPLYGFTANEVLSVGQTRLAISLGEEPLRRMRTSNFIVVDAPSAYSKIKYPVEDKVGEVRGDQLAARRCYVEMVRAESRSARKAPRLESTHELPGISPSVAQHKLHVRLDAQPVKQRKRDFSAEQKVIIQAKVEKLLEAGHIQEVQFPSWLANVVLVAKPGNKWRGYHQVPLAWNDQEKVSFITADDTYCYNVMPFELKNADATYQRLMNKVFRKQIGRNLEVYVDDILIKSLRAVNLCAYIEETFHTLRMYGVKLNPQKYLFGAKSGRFLGYIVTERGIEANPSKVKTLQDMPPP
ncbi:uncharacterized protein LOC122055117 [Zingiber officinale]|uniref:uncharacterized protein LOC122055117 n=1 Tax=Zingiber officinale TaxID=94328 RepID=UPI001C4B8C4C|nr:uncharacterized protein LOC122055117 [Zingiber officinale]